MSEAENTTSNEPVGSIEAAAGAAAETAKANPPEKRDDAPPKPVTATGKKRPKAKKAKKKKAVKAASKKTAQLGGPEQAQVVAAQRKQNAEPPEPPELTEEQAAAKADADAVEAEAKSEAEEIEAQRMEEITALAENLIELTMRPLAEDETQAERTAAVEEVKAELADVAKRGDTAEAAAQCLANADELQAAVVKLRVLHGELVTLSPTDDGRSHAERVKDVQKRSAEIRAKRVRDRLTLLARGAGKSPLDQAAASAPRKSPADADKPPATE